MSEHLIKGTINQRGIVANMGNAIRTQTLAVAELVDNAIAAHGVAGLSGNHLPKLKVSLRFNKDRDSQVVSLQVRDNSVGMTDLQVRNDLFHYMDKKENSKTLNEFGVGAKDALARLAGDLGHISLRTVVAQGAARVVTSIRMKSLREIYSDGVSAETTNTSADEEVGTTWTVHSIKGGISVPSQAAMFSALGSMYRQPIRAGIIQITGYDESDVYYESEYIEPPLLHAFPVSRESKSVLVDQQKKEWKTNVKFQVSLPESLGVAGNTLKVTGWVGALQEMSANHYAGFSLIRRNRVVYMGPKERWAPDPPFSGGGTHLDKRLTGELYCDEIPTTQSKADANNQFSEPLAKALVEHLNAVDPNGVLHQAGNYVKKNYQAFLQSQGVGAVAPQVANPPVASIGSLGSNNIGKTLAAGDGSDQVPQPRILNAPFLFGTFVHPETASLVELIVVPPEDGVSHSAPKWKQSGGKHQLELQVNKVLFATLGGAVSDENAIFALKALVAIAILESIDQERGKQIRSLVRNLTFDSGS
jgi:hypothetical protein